MAAIATPSLGHASGPLGKRKVHFIQCIDFDIPSNLHSYAETAIALLNGAATECPSACTLPTWRQYHIAVHSLILMTEALNTGIVELSRHVHPDRTRPRIARSCSDRVNGLSHWSLFVTCFTFSCKMESLYLGSAVSHMLRDDVGIARDLDVLGALKWDTHRVTAFDLYPNDTRARDFLDFYLNEDLLADPIEVIACVL